MKAQKIAGLLFLGTYFVTFTLIGRSLDRDVPACGFSIGFERIVDLIERSTRRDTIALLTEADVPAVEALAAARTLRRQGRSVEIVGVAVTRGRSAAWR